MQTVSVICDETRNVQKFDFQIGDKITRSLLSVSKVCEGGSGVWFGPAPSYESFIVHDRDAFVAAAGSKTLIFLIMEHINWICMKFLNQLRAQ